MVESVPASHTRHALYRNCSCAGGRPHHRRPANCEARSREAEMKCQVNQLWEILPVEYVWIKCLVNGNFAQYFLLDFVGDCCLILWWSYTAGRLILGMWTIFDRDIQLLFVYFFARGKDTTSTVIHQPIHYKLNQIDLLAWVFTLFRYIQILW